MTQRQRSDIFVDVESRVRANTSRAGFIAGMLIFLGFFVLGGAVGTPIYVASAKILLVALRVGGLVMVGVAIWTAVGSPIAMLLDSGVCGVLGVTLLICATMFLLASEWITGLGALLGGVSLLVSCYHQLRDYRLLQEDDDVDNREVKETGDSILSGRFTSERDQPADAVQPVRTEVQRSRGKIGSPGGRQEKAKLQPRDRRDQARGC